MFENEVKPATIMSEHQKVSSKHGLHARGVQHCKKIHRVYSEILTGLGTLPPYKKGNFPSRDDLKLEVYTLFNLLYVLRLYLKLYIVSFVTSSILQRFKQI